jgi:hypothetical protein
MKSIEPNLYPDIDYEFRPESFWTAASDLLPPFFATSKDGTGMDPQIKYFHTACVTDNSAEAVLLPDAE